MKNPNYKLLEMSEWKEYKLGDVIEIKYGKDHKSLPDGNIPAYGSGGIMRYVEKSIYDKESILIPRKGSLNNIFYKDEPFWTVDTMFWSKINIEIVFPKFLFYQLTTIDYSNLNVGSAVPSLTVTVINEIDVFLPSKKEQTAIAEILTSLDDKIDLLHRQNKTLEQLAETLFRQWFVEEAEESWERKKVKEVCITISKGTTPTTLGRQFKESGINFIKAESLTDLGGFLPDKFAFIDEDTDELLKRSRIQKGDILITIAGTIGRIAYVTEEILPANTNQAISFMRVNKKITTPHFIYCLFKTEEVRNDFEGRVVHAVQPNLSLGEIGDIEFKLPPSEILNKGMKELENLFNKKEKNTNQIHTLTKLRDTLLPKLMSGEVKIK